MCLITLLLDGEQPHVGRLLAGARINADGYGFCIGGYLMYHSLDMGTAIAEFTRLRASHPRGVALFHSRWITAGEGGLQNCQPLMAGEHTVLAHNGTIDSLKEQADREGRSDTRIFIEEGMLPADIEAERERLEAYLGASTMVVIRNGKAHILGEEHGTWVTPGEWQSNSDFLEPGEPVDHQWAASLGHKEARLLYRTLGQQVLGGAGAEVQARRGELLAAHPGLGKGGQ
jgi:predicted glutamine amidotransferase